MYLSFDALVLDMGGYKRKIAEDISTHYRLEGDDFWYERIIGGQDVPLLNIGPGLHPDPRPIGSLRNKTSFDAEESELIKKIRKEISKGHRSK